jgi:sterol desaturase/sphingolipid hydroxylase (fatty acid hydroxylase superfamily)
MDRYLPPGYAEKRSDPSLSKAIRSRLPTIVFNMTWLSLFGSLIAIYAFEPGGFGPRRVLIEYLTIISTHHVCFYLIHRFQHSRGERWFMKAHEKHHSVSHPYPMDSLYENPIDIIIATLGLFVGLLALSPCSIWSWWMVLIHLNVAGIADHSGLKPFRHHFIHHNVDAQSNFSSLVHHLDTALGTISATSLSPACRYGWHTAGSSSEVAVRSRRPSHNDLVETWHTPVEVRRGPTEEAAG